MMTDKCGTNAGYMEHYHPKRGDKKACQPCLDAHATYHRKLRAKHYLARSETLYVDATGTQRRLRALARMGWSFADIGREIGAGWRCPSRQLYNILAQKRVHLDTHKQVEAVYERLSHRQGPSPVAATRARKKGWAPPMAWDAIDDPNDYPKGVLQ